MPNLARSDPRFLMRFSASLLLGGILGLVSLSAQQPREFEVDVDVRTQTIAIKVTGGTEELDRIANVAFNAHGRYRRVTSGQQYTINFTPAGAAAVRVEVLRGTSPVLSQTVNGSSLRNALLRAADVAVKATSNLNGFFASRLAFISERSGQTEVYTGDLFFGEVKQITNDRAHAVTPRWSPDGTKIIYTSFRSGIADILLLDLSTMQRTTFASFKGTNSSARFSPNGQQVAMVLSGEGNPEIYVSNAQGRQVSRRTRTSAVEASPCFSPDGQRLVFTSDSAGKAQLFTMPAAGGTAQRVPTNISGYCAEPDWSRGDPNKIAFTFATGNSFQIAVYDMAGRGAAKQVSKAPKDAIEPVWLADGRHLLYTARAANSRSIWLLDTETGKSTRLSAPELGKASQASVWLP
jgi:TolB protein